ncbi:MAG: hypothetical protein WC551_01115 [Patescibacteria group bacterium]
MILFLRLGCAFDLFACFFCFRVGISPFMTLAMRLRVFKVLAGFVKKPTADKIIPSIFEKGLHQAMAKSVK